MEMITKEIMTNHVVTIENDKTVFEACNKYKDYDVGCLIVTKDNAVVGIITERDIIERAIVYQKKPEETNVEEIMSKEIKTVLDTEPVEKAAEKMKMYKIKKLPVLTKDKDLVGIITLTDIANILPKFTKMLTDED